MHKTACTLKPFKAQCIRCAFVPSDGLLKHWFPKRQTGFM